MPEKRTLRRARRDARQGKSASTQAGEFVREEMHHIRSGKHGARNSKQAIAIGLSKARRSGVKLAPPKAGRTSTATRKKAESDLERGRHPRRASSRRSTATRAALKREGRSAASRPALSKQARRAAGTRRKRGAVTARTSRRRTTTARGSRSSSTRRRTTTAASRRRTTSSRSRTTSRRGSTARRSRARSTATHHRKAA